MWRHDENNRHKNIIPHAWNMLWWVITSKILILASVLLDSVSPDKRKRIIPRSTENTVARIPNISSDWIWLQKNLYSSSHHTFYWCRTKYQIPNDVEVGNRLQVRTPEKPEQAYELLSKEKDMKYKIEINKSFMKWSNHVHN